MAPGARGCHGRSHLAWLSEHLQGGVGWATQVMELCCHRGGGLPAVHGESVGKLEGRGLLTWAPVPSPFLSLLS